MFRWLLEKTGVKSFFKEDPYFKVQVDEDLERNLVRVTVKVIRSSATWRGKFKVDGRTDFPIETRVLGSYDRDGKYFVLMQNLTDKNEVEVKIEAIPLRTGTGRVQFWFERKVGIGGQISVVGAIFGQGDQELIQKNEEYQEKHWNKWLEDNPDWSDADSA